MISHILAEFHPEMATYTTLHNHFSLMHGLSKSAQTFTVGFVKLPSSHSIHIVVWGNFPFKGPGSSRGFLCSLVLSEHYF